MVTYVKPYITVIEEDTAQVLMASIVIDDEWATDDGTYYDDCREVFLDEW